MAVFRALSSQDRAACLLLLVLLLLHQPIGAAVIPVDATCTLVDAIDAANNDDDAGGLCPPGGSGADTLRLTGDVTLTALHNTTRGANGLPIVVTDITIDGRGYAVARDAAAPEFRLLYVGVGGDLLLENVTLRDGVATQSGFYGAVGGAIFSRYAGLQLSGATLEGNGADSGGALFGYFSTVILSESTISGNSAIEYGGGIGGYVTSITGINSTVSGNTAGSSGGGIWGGYGSSMGLFNSTISANSASLGGGISDYGSFGNQVSVYGSVIGYNAGGACAVYFINGGANNLDDDGTCGATFEALSGLDPTLADNGGPTLTHALLPGSSAIDAAGDCGLENDQRGFARGDGACDSGSFELGAGPAFALSVGGTCPGEITVELTTPNPDQDVIIFAGPGEGTSYVPWGPCAGTELDLAFGRQWRALTTGENGEASISRTVTSSWCGRYLQALDRSCATSGAAQFP